MGNIESRVLTAALEKLEDVSAGADLETTLHDVVDAADTMFRVRGAGLMFLDGTDALRYVVSSDTGAHILEVAQEELGAGPCVDSLVLSRPVATVDVEDDERWPGLGDLVVPAGVRAVLGVPVHAGTSAVGSLNAYSTDRHEWDDSEVDALTRLASIIEAVVASALLARQHSKLVDQLQYALDRRVVIERAIGYVMGRAGDLDAVAAFNRLRILARNERRRVAEVATDVLDGTVEV
jgi:GAF domain-containing protein